jgi:hypothetical protein
LTWTGTGTLLQEILHERFHAPHFVFQSRFSGTSRDAVASGSVSLGGTNLTPKPSDFAYIASVKSGKVVIE